MKTFELKVVEKEEAKNVAQEVDALVAKAAAAGEKLRGFTQEQRDRQTMALAGVEHHVELAKLAWEETGKGFMKTRSRKPLCHRVHLQQH